MRCLSLFTLLLALVLGGCSTPGGFFGRLAGTPFPGPRASDDGHALVYLYRPQSAWADQELEAPGLFVDNQLLGSLPSNGYLLLELEVDSYRLEMRRPLFGSYWTALADGPMDFTRIASFVLEAEAGGVYYLRYDELNPPASSAAATGAGDGPLQLLAGTTALAEIAATREVQPPRRAAARAAVERPQRGFWRKVGELLQHVGI